MGKTKIQWTNFSINFWHGCTKVSPGCKYCYMFREKENRYGQDPRKLIKTKESYLKNLLKKIQPDQKIFTCSWSDFFIKGADEWRAEAWKTIKNHPEFIWQILTKRVARIEKNLPDDWGYGYPNVWLGTSIESDKYKYRLEILQELKTKKSTFKTFVSAEPLIGHLDFTEPISLSYDFDNLDWLIIGGESGNDTGYYRYRPCKIEWIEKLINDAKDSNVPVFVKQLGTHLAKEFKLHERHGGDIEEWPRYFKIREFPKI